MLQSINPFNGDLLFESEYISLSEAEKKIIKCKEAYQSWRVVSLHNRIEKIQRLSSLLRAHKHHLARLITLEMGKLIIESEAEIEKCAGLCDYYVKHAEEFLANEMLQTRFKSTIIQYQSIGVILGIMPWNFPFWQVIRFAVPTLLAGNTVLLKHASNVSLCSIEIHKLFCEALSNEHIFQSLLFKAADADKILRSGLINGVSVTGSEEAGRKVGESAGTAIIKQVYELGGNDAFIVFEKVDIQETVKEAVKARLINCGQSCISAKRFIIHNNIFDEFVGELTTAFRSKSFGNPLDKQTRLAPLAKKSFAIELEAKVDSAINNKALALLPNHRDEAFLTPNILLDVNEYNPIYDEEIFGPVAIVHRFNTIEEAIQKANSSRYGLSSSVWSEDLSVANFVATQLECGSVYINTYPQSDSAIPFGGVKYSGYGREMGRDGMLEFVNRKAVVIN